MNPKDDIVPITDSIACFDSTVMNRLRDDFDNIIGVINREWQPFFTETNLHNEAEAILTPHAARPVPGRTPGSMPRHAVLPPALDTPSDTR